MDPVILEQLIPLAAAQLGLAPSTLVFSLMVLGVAARLLSRLIPDDATGWRSVVHKIARFIAVDVSNRITKGVSQTDIARKVVGTAVEAAASAQIEEMAGDAASLIPEVVGDNVRSIARDSLEAMRRRGEIDPNPDK